MRWECKTCAGQMDQMPSPYLFPADEANQEIDRMRGLIYRLQEDNRALRSLLYSLELANQELRSIIAAEVSWRLT